MPLYCIHGLDKPDSADLRASNYDAHRAFLATCSTFGVRMAASGPLVGEDGSNMIGSLLIVEAETLAEVQAFNAADPFAKAGLWHDVTITRFHLRVGTIGS